MTFLADAGVSNEIVDICLAKGHSCTAASALQPGLSDEQVLSQAEAEQRVLITMDKDFGGLVFLGGSTCPGVVLIRAHCTTMADQIARFADVFHEVVRHLPGAFVVIGETSIRIRPMPSHA